MLFLFPCFFSSKSNLMKAHFVLGTACIIGNHLKFVGLHAVMLWKGFHFIAAHVVCCFSPKSDAVSNQRVWGHIWNHLVTFWDWLEQREAVSIKSIKFRGFSKFRPKFIGEMRWKFILAFFQGMSWTEPSFNFIDLYRGSTPVVWGPLFDL